MVDGSYRQEFGWQAAGFERVMGLLLQQVSEQFVAKSMILLRGGRREV